VGGPIRIHSFGELLLGRSWAAVKKRSVELGPVKLEGLMADRGWSSNGNSPIELTIVPHSGTIVMRNVDRRMTTPLRRGGDGQHGTESGYRRVAPLSLGRGVGDRTLGKDICKQPHPPPPSPVIGLGTRGRYLGREKEQTTRRDGFHGGSRPAAWCTSPAT